MTGGLTRVALFASSSYFPSISSDGRYVAFQGLWDVRLYDMANDNMKVISKSLVRAPATERSEHPAISSDGQWIAFHSSESDLVPDDTNGYVDVFVHKRPFSVLLPLVMK